MLNGSQRGIWLPLPGAGEPSPKRPPRSAPALYTAGGALEPVTAAAPPSAPWACLLRPRSIFLRLGWGRRRDPNKARAWQLGARLWSEQEALRTPTRRGPSGQGVPSGETAKGAFTQVQPASPTCCPGARRSCLFQDGGGWGRGGLRTRGLWARVAPANSTPC